MLKRESGMRKAKGSYRTYSSLVKLEPRFHEFAMENLPLGRIAALVPGFVVKDLPLDRIHNDDDRDSNKERKLLQKQDFKTLMRRLGFFY